MREVALPEPSIKLTMLFGDVYQRCMTAGNFCGFLASAAYAERA